MRVGELDDGALDIVHDHALGDLEVDPHRGDALRDGVLETRGEIALAQLDRRNVDGDAGRFEARLHPAAVIERRASQRPGADLDDQAGLFEQRHEFHGRYQPELGTLPADQRLDPDDTARLEVDFRLVMQG